MGAPDKEDESLRRAGGRVDGEVEELQQAEGELLL